MNKKFLLGAFAVAGLLASCSSDEMDFGNAPVNNPIKGRVPVNYSVEFKTGETRFDELSGKFTEGDKFGMYLMDEFNSPYFAENQHAMQNGENQNANTTHWRNQNVWWNMYSFVDYIQTNYPYEYNEADKTWKNKAAALIEGNYIVAWPQQELATNRRDLWYYINPNVQLKKTESSKYAQFFYNIESEFSLGYTQIYRDEKAVNEDNLFQLRLDLHPVLSRVRFLFYNGSSLPFQPTKIVFKKTDNTPIKTIALVKPASGDLQQMLSANTKTVQVDGPCETKVNETWFDREKSFTQEMAREMVQYVDPSEGYVPYGCTPEQAEVAYEMSYSFPEGTEVQGNNNNDPYGLQSVFAVYLGIPDEVLAEGYEVMVYGKKFDPLTKEWRYGVYKDMSNYGGDPNKKFELDKVKVWKEGDAVPQASLRLDDLSFQVIEQLEVGSKEELMQLISGKLSQIENSDDITFVIEPYGKGIVIDDEVIAQIEEWEQKNGQDVTLKFVPNNRTTSTPIILEAEEAVSTCIFDRSTVVVKAKQTIESAGNSFTAITNESDLYVKAPITVVNTLLNTNDGYVKIENNISAGQNATIENYGNMDIYTSNLGVTINNYNELNIKGSVKTIWAPVRLVINQQSGKCTECGETTNPVLTIFNGGRLEADITGATVNVNANGILVTSAVNSPINNNGTVKVDARYVPTINASVSGEGTFHANYYASSSSTANVTNNWPERNEYNTYVQKANTWNTNKSDFDKKDAAFGQYINAYIAWSQKSPNAIEHYSYAQITEGLNKVTVENKLQTDTTYDERAAFIDALDAMNEAFGIISNIPGGKISKNYGIIEEAWIKAIIEYARNSANPWIVANEGSYRNKTNPNSVPSVITCGHTF